MKKIYLIILMMALIPAGISQVLITRNCDPKNNYAPDRFTEIYNAGTTIIDLTGWTLENIQNNAVVFSWTLSGNINPGETKVCARANTTDQTITPDYTANWSGSSWNGKDGDGTRLKNSSNILIDDAVQEDSSSFDFDDGQMKRKLTITSPNDTYNSNEWVFSKVNDALDVVPGFHGTVWQKNTVWATVGNWDNELPTEFSDVYIPSGISSFPTISASAECHNITIESGASLIGSENLTVYGTATMQRSIDGYTEDVNGWHLLSSPVNNMVIAGSDFVPGTETPNLDDFFAWNESTWEWLNYKVTGNNITDFENGQGYLVSYETTSTKNFTGTFNNSDVTFTNLSLTDPVKKGWHLVGNPFQSALQWTNTDWIRTNIDETAKVMNNGGSYDDITIDGTYQYIPANQGFFIQVTTDNSNTFTIPVSQCVHNSTAFYKNSIPNILTLKAIVGNYYQESTIQFMDGSTDNYDEEYDAEFLAGISEEAPHFYSIVDNYELSTNRIPTPENESIVLMGFSTEEEKIITIEAYGIDSFSNDIDVFLEDLEENVIIDLKKVNSYTFVSTPENNIERFNVHFGSTLGVNETISNVTNIYIFSTNNIITLLNNSNAKGDVSIVNIMGQEIASYSLNGNSKQQISIQANSGVYIVNVRTSNGNVVSEKVIITK